MGPLAVPIAWGSRCAHSNSHKPSPSASVGGLQALLVSDEPRGHDHAGVWVWVCRVYFSGWAPSPAC
eukprot:1153572-Pelagomonas_calceolata.AAC.1